MQEQKEITEILRKFLNNDVDGELIKRADHMLWYLEHAQSGSSSFSAHFARNQIARADNDWLGASSRSQVEVQVEVQDQSLSRSQELGRLGNWPTSTSFGADAQSGLRKDSRAESNAGFGFDFGKWPKPGTGTPFRPDGDFHANASAQQPGSFWASAATAFSPGDQGRLRALGWGATPTQPSGEGWWLERASASQAQSRATTQPGQSASWGTWDVPADCSKTTATVFGRFATAQDCYGVTATAPDRKQQLVQKDTVRWIDDVPSAQTYRPRTEQSHSRWIDGLDTHVRVGTEHDD